MNYCNKHGWNSTGKTCVNCARESGAKMPEKPISQTQAKPSTVPKEAFDEMLSKLDRCNKECQTLREKIEAIKKILE